MAGFAYYVIQRNDTTNDSIFHMSGGMQGVYSKILGGVNYLSLYLSIQYLNLLPYLLCKIIIMAVPQLHLPVH